MIGETIGHYKVLKLLGTGGMGEVYLAEDTRLGRKVALKFLSASWANDTEALQRFQSEARTAATLSHPNIAIIHQFEEVDGRRFLVLEYVEGETLLARVARGPLPADEILRIGKALAAALAHAHEAGIVHRDIKSANVILTPAGVPKILDFGLAKRREETRVTRAGTTVGTAGYMSPEQARGKDADARSDLWSLGVVMYEALVGRTPFEADSLEATIGRVLTDTPEPPTALRSGVSLDLERVILRCLEKDPGLRYQHADDLLADLRGIESRISKITKAATAASLPAAPAAPTSGEQPSVGGSAFPSSGSFQRPPSGSGPVATGTNRRPLAMGVAILAVVAVAVAAFFMTRGGGAVGSSATNAAGEPPEPSIAVVDFRNLSDPADNTASTILTSLVQTGLIESSPCRVVSNEYLKDLRRRLFGAPVGPIEQDQALELAREGGTSTLLLGEVAKDAQRYTITWRLVDATTGEALGARRIEGESYASLADSAVAGVLPLLAASCEVGTPTITHSVSELTTKSPEAYAHYIAAREALDEFRSKAAVEEAGKAIALDPAFALAHFAMAQAQFGVSNPRLGFEYMEKAWEHRERMTSLDRMKLEAYRARWNQEDRKAESIYEQIYSEAPDDREAIDYIISMRGDDGRFREALALQNRLIELYPDNAEVNTQMAYVLAWNRRYDEALAATNRAISRFPQNPNGWDTKGDMFRYMAMPDSMEAAYRKTLELDPSFVSAELGVADAKWMGGDLDGATRYMEAFVGRSDDPQWKLRSNAWVLAGFYSFAGRFGEARRVRKSIDPKLIPDRFRPFLVLAIAGGDLEAGSARGALEDLNRLKPEGLPASQQREYHTLKGAALAAVGDVDGAQQELDVVTELVKHEPQTSGKRLGQLELQARVALAADRPREALIPLRTMLEIKKTPYSSTRHGQLFAEAYRRAQQFEQAREILDEFHAHRRGWPGYHYQMGRIYEDEGRAREAIAAYERFVSAWKRADKDAPELVDAKDRLAALKVRA